MSSDFALKVRVQPPRPTAPRTTDSSAIDPSPQPNQHQIGLCIFSRDWWIMIPTEGVMGKIMPVALFHLEENDNGGSSQNSWTKGPAR